MKGKLKTKRIWRSRNYYPIIFFERHRRRCRWGWV